MNSAVKLTAIAILSLGLASTASATLIGDSYNFSISATGSVTILSQSGPGPYIAPAGPSFCVGPAANACSSSGLFGSVTMSATQVIFNFFGSTNPSTGTFVVNLTNFLPANITNVTYNSGALSGGTFGLASFSASSMVFTGTSTDNGFNAVGGSQIAFDVATAAPATITKSFNPAKIAPGGTSTLTLAITNPNAFAIAGVAFTDTYPAGVTTASPSNLTNTCGGAAVATSGSVSLTGGTIAASSTCAVTVSVTSTEGIRVNSVTVTSNFGTGNTATATLTAATPPVLSKSFGEVSIGPGNTVGLTFTLRNPNTVLALNALAFTDVLPAGLVVSTPGVVTGVCDSGTITAVANSNTISLAGASLAAGASCTFKVNVTANGAALSTLTNTTSTVSSTEATPGAAASATIFVGDPFQVSYASNLAVGDSYVDVTNTGALGAALQSGTTASITGAICANVYAFTPDEQLVSCCSCPVTPNGLVSLSAKNDLASNTLTPAIPSALVIKLVASVPVGGSCNNSAAGVTAATLANGMKSFETTLHATPVAGSYGVTETPFSSATMSAGELSRVTNLCNFILANGSGFGVCRSCRLGGLGSERQ